jgi:leucyl aminopeptidase
MPLALSVQLAADAPRGAAIGVGVFATSKGPQLPAGVNLSAAVLKGRGFDAKLGQTLAVPGRGGTQILVGLGDAGSLSVDSFRTAAAALARAGYNETVLATSLIDSAPTRLDRASVAQAVTEGLLLATYAFTSYKSKPTARALTTVVLTGRRGRIAAEGVAKGQLVSEGVALNRDLVNEPAMTLTPRHFADLAATIGAASGIDVVVWDETDIERERLGGMRAVSLGSDEPPRFVKMTYTPKNAAKGKKIPTLALVGKGITFDSGGLSLKPNDGMLTMKCDMSGAGAVLGVMSIISRLAPACRVVGYLCITENMPGPSAFKLLDVLTARNGKTVEIYNTDAEGRLVLMDGLSLAVEDKADAIIDLATLTGAAIVALGNDMCALLCNSPAFRSQILDASDRAGEDMWHLPLHKKYRKHLDSPIADLKNIGLPMQAGTIVAGLFLEEFVDGKPWAHLDIAGPAFTSGDEGLITRGGTGFGVRTLVETIMNFKVPSEAASRKTTR